MLNFLLIILLAISDGTDGSDPTNRASPGEFNYFVMVWYRNQFWCGGTIIDRRHIITRATCVGNIPSSDLSIIAGSNDITTDRTRPLQVESVHIHYGFKAVHDHWEHDIAILKLVNRMVWDLRTAPVVYGDYNRTKGINLAVPVWRVSITVEQFQVRWSRPVLYNNEFCIEKGVLLLKNEECAQWPFMSEKYAKDDYRGSPFVYGNTVIGIIDGPKRGDYWTFLRLFPYKDFIENVIDDRKHDASPGDANYVVSIWDQGSFKCGGIILSAFYILTTGYYVEFANSTDLQVIAGYTQVLDNDPLIRRLSITEIELHPGYDPIIHVDGSKSMTIKNNYAILTAIPLEWGLTIGPMPFSTEYFTSKNPVCRAFRWHYAYTVDDEMVLQLVWSQVSIVSPEVCRQEGVDVGADEICVHQSAQHPKSLDSSGNPVVCENCAIGMILPDFSTVPHFSCLTSVHSLSPLINSMESACYRHPT